MNRTMRLSNLDSNNIIQFANEAYLNRDYEFECLIKEPKPNRDSFIRVMGLCKDKTCTSSWKNIKERSKTLDISIGSYRISICGKYYIEQYFKSDKLDDIPKGTWYVIQKKQINNEYLSIGCRINLKEEIPVDTNSSEFGNILANWRNLKKLFRLKNRYSYLVDEMYSVDLTAVRTGKLAKTLRSSGTFDSNETYEIELEYVPNIIGEESYEFNIDTWSETLEGILCSFRNTWKIASIKEISDVEKAYYETLLKRDIHNDFKEVKNSNWKYKISPNVISLNMERLRIMKHKASEYYVTPKSDGLRMTGFVSETGELYLFGSRSELYQPTGYLFSTEYVGSIFDGEMISYTKNGDRVADYLIFDCYYYKGIDIRNKFFDERLNHAKDILANVESVDTTYYGETPNVTLKKFIPMTAEGFHLQCKECLDDVEKGIYDNDGLIFTPIDKVGGNSLYDKGVSSKKFIKSGKDFKRLLKWKDSSFNSIDFKIKFLEEIEKPLRIGDEYVMTKFMKCSLFVKYDKEPKSFTIEDFVEEMNSDDKQRFSYNKPFLKQFVPFDPEDDKACYVKIPIFNNEVRCKHNDSWNGSKIGNNDIVEMIYDKDAEVEHRWIPLRIRKDKDSPNFYKVAMDIWQSYHLPVTKEMIIGEAEIPSNDEEIDTYYNGDTNTDTNLRRFHRLCIKKQIFEDTIVKTKGKRLLDLGSGKGGDIPRYIDSGASVIGIDSSVDNLHNQNNGAYRRLANILKDDRGHKSKSRYSKNALNNIVFITGDAGKPFTDSSTFDLPKTDGIYKRYVIDNKIFDKKHTFDVATVFFALHYFFRNENTLDTFLKNIADNIKIGGYFAGCCYDGKIIDDELHKSNKDLIYRDSTGTEILRIKKHYKGRLNDDISSLGKEIHVLVQSIDMIHPEYLVNFKLLTSKLFELGFKNIPESSNNFEYYYQSQRKNKIILSEEEREASFLNRTFVFQRFSYGVDDIANDKILEN
tara:strand:- start:10418 stop:13348 length:2931 start_codon:yes stop_codon:yes gene_type:complete